MRSIPGEDPDPSALESESARHRSSRPLVGNGATATLVVAIALLAGLAAVPLSASAIDTTASSATDDATIVVSDETVTVDDSARHQVKLTEAPEGLAGFALTLDLDDTITDGATDVTLAWIEITGETALRVTDAQVDADGGTPIDPAFEAGTITTVDTADADSGDDTGADSGDDTDVDAGDDAATTETSDEDALPGFTIGAMIGAFAVIAAVAFVRGRSR